MLMDVGYYYSNLKDCENIDIAPTGEDIFVISAGHYKLITLDSYSVKTMRDDYLLAYVNNGSLSYKDGDSSKSTNAGTFLLFRPGEFQDVIFYLKDSPDIYWVHFAGNMILSLLKENNLLDSRSISVMPNNRYSDIFDLMIKALKSPDDYSSKLNKIYLQELILTASKERDFTLSRTKTPTEFTRALQFIDDNLSEKIMLKDIAEYSNVSTKTLTRYFEKFQNMPPMKYVNKMRMEKAKILLKGHNTVGQVSNALGFEDPLYFSTVFRKYTGISPEKFKKSL